MNVLPARGTKMSTRTFRDQAVDDFHLIHDHIVPLKYRLSTMRRLSSLLTGDRCQRLSRENEASEYVVLHYWETAEERRRRFHWSLVGAMHSGIPCMGQELEDEMKTTDWLAWLSTEMSTILVSWLVQQEGRGPAEFLCYTPTKALILGDSECCPRRLAGCY